MATLTVVAAALGALSAYYSVKASDVTQERDAVRGKATNLETQQADLAQQLDELKTENADLRARLDDKSGSPGTGPGAADVAYRRLTVPLPADGDDANLILDRGEVATECCVGEMTYSRNDETGIPELTADVPYSTDVPSAAATQEECSQAVKTSPTITPIRKLRNGTVICATSDGGTSLLRISEPPRKNGTLKMIQTFWPGSDG